MTTTALIPQAELAKTRNQVLALIPPLQAEVSELVVTTPDEYTYADSLLTRVRTSRAWWLEGDPNPKSKWRGINALIKPFYDGLQGLYDLRNDGSKPHDEMEDSIKAKMKTFKIEEKRQLAEATRKKQEEEARLQHEIEEAKQKEEAARTVQTRARVIERRMGLEQTQREVHKEKPLATKAKGSSSREIKKPVVTDFAEFAEGVLKFQADGIPLDLLMVNSARLQQMWKDDPDLVAQLPGITVEEDIVIAGR